jgi:hypothetical protein
LGCFNKFCASSGSKTVGNLFFADLSPFLAYTMLNVYYTYYITYLLGC